MRPTAFLLLSMCLALTGKAFCYEAPVQPTGEAIGDIKALPDGRVAKLYKEHITKMRTQEEVGPHDYAGEWSYDTYHLVLHDPKTGGDEVVWKQQRNYFTLQAKITREDVRVFDLTLDKGVLTVLFSRGAAITVETWAKETQGRWSRVSLRAVPTLQIDWLDRTVTKGEILPDQVVQLNYKNGDIEKWSYSQKVPRRVWANDLKVKYNLPPESE